MIETLEQALARADAMTKCSDTQIIAKVLADEVRRLQAMIIVLVNYEESHKEQQP